MIHDQDIARINPTLRFPAPRASQPARPLNIDAQKASQIAGRENAYIADEPAKAVFDPSTGS